MATAGGYIWRKPGSLRDNKSPGGTILFAVYRKEPPLPRAERNCWFLGPIAERESCQLALNSRGFGPSRSATKQQLAGFPWPSSNSSSAQCTRRATDAGS